ncbi:tetratricopeptide repeat-containing glycosyltransferase family protein [Uliginosibacterium paludis]|uniref:Tetratricopeptide repeat-containing glycosyltransferase family protein n=1 Tax=Uliginosibacterium paludis TaxID=1615952 RepID=A0ABV2CKJ4_9RHOO
MMIPEAAGQTPAQSLFHEALVLIAEGHPDEALLKLRQACALEPDFIEAWGNMGFLLDRGGDREGAELCYLRAIELGGTHPQLFLNYGALLNRAKRHAEAEAVYHEGLREDPRSAALWSNLGVLFANLKRDAHAENCFRTALDISPDYSSARYNLGFLQLRQGLLREGFAGLEARDWYASMEKVLSDTLGIPRWKGESLEGRSILISCEAGAGDMIQFSRYASELRKRGARRVDILCHPGLTRLFASLADADRIHALDQSVSSADWDCWSPPLSLPHYCGTEGRNIPAPIPYLHATPEDLLRWQACLPTSGLRVGLVWQGNPRFENDSERSLRSVADLAPLWTVPGVSFVSLQKGAGEDDAVAFSRLQPLSLIGPQLQDFADTAAVLANLDLVISVDTAVAHLAGAMGVPCWLMLPDYGTDWRWQRERTDSAWYPQGMRLFRQERDGNWAPVIMKLAAALGTLAMPQRAATESRRSA